MSETDWIVRYEGIELDLLTQFVRREDGLTVRVAAKEAGALALIMRGGGATFVEIAERLECSEDAARLYIHRMRKYGIDIMCKWGTGRYFVSPSALARAG